MNEHQEESHPAMIELPGPSATRTVGDLVITSLDAVKDVKVSLAAIAGEATMSIGEMLAIREGQIVKLGTSVEDPFDLTLDGRTVARGELVAVDNNFGIRIVDVPTN